MKSITCILLLLLTAFASGQNQTAEQIVQKNLDFYNQRDLEGFSSLLSNDVALYEFGNSKPIATGLQSVKALYKNLFEKSPELHSTLLKRIVIGNKVIDHESIVGRNGKKDVLELVVIYEVANQKITKLSVIRK